MLASDLMRIKLTIPGQSLNLSLKQFTGNSENVFDGCKFHVNERIESADAWFVFEDAVPDDSECEVPPNQVHFLSAEASWRKDKYLSLEAESFLRQFSKVHSCHPIRLNSQHFEAPFLPWMINANHENIFDSHQRDLEFFRELEELPKDRPLSVFCSSQAWTPDHALRLAFVENLKRELGEDLEWFGNGVNPVEEKWQGLARFERTLVLENRSDRGIYTEKILDAFLGLSVPIYWGAPDIQHYLPVPKSYQLNIADFRGSTREIRKLLSTRVSSADKDRLIDGKRRVISDLHFLGRIARIAKKSVAGASPTLISLRTRSSFISPEQGDLSAKARTANFLYRRIIRPLKASL